EDVGFAGAYSFVYSPRPGTPAAEMDDQVPAEIKLERLHRLQALIVRQQRAFNESFVGRKLDVLLEKPGTRPGQLAGRSPYLQTVHVMAPRALIGSTAKVTITEAGTNTLFGVMDSSSLPRLESGTSAAMGSRADGSERMPSPQIAFGDNPGA